MTSRVADILARISAPPSPEEHALHEQLIAAIPSMAPPMRRRVIDALAETVATEVFAALTEQRKAEAEARRAKATEQARPRRKRLQQQLAALAPAAAAQ